MRFKLIFSVKFSFQILVRLSSPTLNIQQKIADFKGCPLEPEEEKRIQEEIQKWKDYEADVDRLKEEMTDVKERVTKMENTQEVIYRRQTEGLFIDIFVRLSE
jgi:hypothetical protein